MPEGALFPEARFRWPVRRSWRRQKRPKPSLHPRWLDLAAFLAVATSGGGRGFGCGPRPRQRLRLRAHPRLPPSAGSQRPVRPPSIQPFWCQEIFGLRDLGLSRPAERSAPFQYLRPRDHHRSGSRGRMRFAHGHEPIVEYGRPAFERARFADPAFAPSVVLGFRLRPVETRSAPTSRRSADKRSWPYRPPRSRERFRREPGVFTLSCSDKDGRRRRGRRDHLAALAGFLLAFVSRAPRRACAPRGHGVSFD